MQDLKRLFVMNSLGTLPSNENGSTGPQFRLEEVNTMAYSICIRIIRGQSRLIVILCKLPLFHRKNEFYIVNQFRVKKVKIFQTENIFMTLKFNKT